MAPDTSDTDREHAQAPISLAGHRYIKTLGEGGNGCVYQFLDTSLQREVAIKALSPEVRAKAELILAQRPDGKPLKIHPAHEEFERALSRLKREALALAQLRHENIVTAYRFIDDESNPQLILEYVDGPTLRSLIESGPLPLYVAAIISARLASALDHLHFRKIIHRDLKPENVMLTKAGGVKLLDLGVAKDTTLGPITKEDTTPGTLQYMSPEQANGDPPDHRTDIFSLGVILYESLTGKHPFPGNTWGQIHERLRSGRYKPLDKELPEIPPAITKVVRNALQLDVAQRFPDAAAMQRELDLFLAQEVRESHTSVLVAFLHERRLLTRTEATERLKNEFKRLSFYLQPNGIHGIKIYTDEAGQPKRPSSPGVKAIHKSSPPRPSGQTHLPVRSAERSRARLAAFIGSSVVLMLAAAAVVWPQPRFGFLQAWLKKDAPGPPTIEPPTPESPPPPQEAALADARSQEVRAAKDPSSDASTAAASRPLGIGPTDAGPAAAPAVARATISDMARDAGSTIADLGRPAIGRDAGSSSVVKSRLDTAQGAGLESIASNRPGTARDAGVPRTVAPVQEPGPASARVPVPGKGTDSARADAASESADQIPPDKPVRAVQFTAFRGDKLSRIQPLLGEPTLVFMKGGKKHLSYPKGSAIDYRLQIPVQPTVVINPLTTDIVSIDVQLAESLSQGAVIKAFGPACGSTPGTTKSSSCYVITTCTSGGSNDCMYYSPDKIYASMDSSGKVDTITYLLSAAQ